MTGDPMVKFNVHTFGEHVIDNMVVTGPYRDIIMTMAEMFLATYAGLGSPIKRPLVNE